MTFSPSQLEIRGSYPILQDVFVNGKGPYRMLVDTGAQTTSVRPRVAAEAGLRPVFAVELRNALGTSFAPVAQADRIASGEMVIRGAEVLITEPPAIPGANPLDGVIGQSFLSRTNYWLDFDKKHVRWDPDGLLHQCLDGERLKFSLVDGRPALEARLVADDRATRTVVLDSGASHLILYGWRGASNATGFVRTAQGQGTARVIRIASMSVGGLNWRGLTAGAVETEGRGADGPGADGLLPAHLLKSFYVNNREQYVLAAPRVSAHCANAPAGPLARRGESAERAW